jgi:hypothetical protein
MRRAVVFFCIALNISFMLMSVGTLHMHISSDHHHEHVLLHGGHVHDHDHERHELPASDHVINVHAGASQSMVSAGEWKSFGLLLAVLGVWCLALPYVTPLLRPPSVVHPFPGRPSYWRPPLRGPPAFSI